MALIHLFLLAIVQGVTEFLPVSSSAHLVLFPKVVGVMDQGLIMDVAVHIGSLLAVLVFFYKDVLKLAQTTVLYRKAEEQDKNLLKHVIVASLPVVIAGAVLHYYLPNGLRNVMWIAWASIGFGLLLWAADHFGKTDKSVSDMTVKNAFWIGLAHICALFPGASRSGVTMSMARACGLSRVEAARFSLLIGIPVIAGAGVVGLYDLIRAGNIELGFDVLLAVLFSFFSALGAIVVMMKFLKSFSFLPFVIYRVALGVALLFFFGG